MSNPTETRLRVFRKPDGTRYVRQLTEYEVLEWLANHPEDTLVR